MRARNGANREKTSFWTHLTCIFAAAQTRRPLGRGEPLYLLPRDALISCAMGGRSRCGTGERRGSEGGKNGAIGRDDEIGGGDSLEGQQTEVVVSRLVRNRECLVL